MVSPTAIKTALSSVTEIELLRLTRIADRFLAGHPLTISGNRMHKSRAGAGREFLDYREYAVGDDLRRIDWRASSRADRLQVRRHHDESYSRWFICLDRSASMGINAGDKWLTAIKLASALGYILLHRGARVGLISFSDKVDDYCEPGQGRQQHIQILNRLRDAAPDEHGGASRLASCCRYLSRNSSVIVISDFLAEDAMISGIDALRASGVDCHLFHLQSADDTNAYGGELLEDIESGRQLFATDGQAGSSAAARSKLQQLNDQLRSACRRRAIPITTASCLTPWPNIVGQHLAASC